MLSIAFIGMTIFIGHQIVAGYTNAMPRETTIENSKHFLIGYSDLVKKYKVENLSIPSTYDSHKVPAFLAKKDGNNNIAILVHGMGGTKETTYSVAQMFLDLGYDTLAIDQRNSGENMADENTFGYKESFDVLDAINYASELSQYDKKLLWGESYGGLTSVIAAGRDDSKIDYLILDCPVSDGGFFTKEIYKEVSSEQGIPIAYMEFSEKIMSKIKLGFTVGDTDASEWIKNADVPVLIFNSKVDTVTPEYMGERLYNAISHNKKEIFTSETSPHVEIRVLEKDEYIKEIKNFLDLY